MPLPRLRPASDEQLVTRFRAGDERAFDAIVERFRPRLVRYAASMLRSRGSHAAEDAVQDVFVRAYPALRADARPMALRAWLYRIAHNQCLNVLRTQAPLELDTERACGADAGADVAWERSERLRRLVADIQCLPPNQRSALVIREIDGLSYVEIAEALGVTVPAVKSLLVRARMNLAEAAEAREAAAERAVAARLAPVAA